MKGVDHTRPDIRQMRAYEEEQGSGLNLAANTNLFGVNPAIERALARARPSDLTEYPSLSSATLRGAIAHKLGVLPEQVVTGNGSNDLIDVLLRTFVTPGDRVAAHAPTFSMIPLFARMNHAVPVPVALGANWSLDADALLAAEAKITFLVRPNNPTGNAFPRRDVERVIEGARGLVVVDEAYIEFLGGVDGSSHRQGAAGGRAGESFVKEVREGRDNVVVLRTFSKAYGMAGLRVGYAVANLTLAHEMNKVRGPYRLDSLAETAATMALQDDKFLHDVVTGVRLERPNLKRVLEDRGFHVFRSDANFLFTQPPYDADILALGLAKRGVYVREFGGDLAPYLRITVGPPAATARLVVALDEVIEVIKGGGA
ncbi:MAG TPA: histidinol-phosphate transaminase [Candidatus Thermoplasmatota archaeon]|nr:histidinol-phosphate transaminase [Candidatus Thermoplasmatota archaeon]